ncbi:metallophosphoesterase [Haloferula sp.]|uniref:metallophosphoesterase n=1 Tax=Haloferula sp. TaxID=2497595 RepID=UPI003C71D756
MNEPVLILSDLHLGLPASRISAAEQLRPLIEGAGTVIFNGDTFQELAKAYRPHSEVLLEDLKAICRELGAQPLFLPGNHDPGWGGPGWAELAGGRIIVTHGDSVMWGGSPWSRESISRADQVRELWAQNERADYDPEERMELANKMALLLRPATVPKGRSLFRRVADAVNPPRRAFEILRVWWEQAEKAAIFGKRYFPKSEVLILGHFHRRGVWTRSGRLIVNTGAFVNPNRANWVGFQDGWLTVGKVKERNGKFFRGESDAVWRAE